MNKDLLKYLPQLLEILPKIIKYVPALLIIGLLGFVIYYFIINYSDPYLCHDNEIYERISVDSNVYKFVGGYCREGKTNTRSITPSK
jgi:hypothetical protein